MDTPYFPTALQDSTIGPVRHRRRPAGGRWTDFAARLRDRAESDDPRVTTRRQTVASAIDLGDAVAIAHHMLAALTIRRH